MASKKPIGSAADIAKAKDALKDEKAKKRANSNLMYSLQANGHKGAYDATPSDARKEFFVAWLADKLKNGETTSSGSKDLGSKNESGSSFQWVGKHQLVTMLGQESGGSHCEQQIIDPSRPDHRLERLVELGVQAAHRRWLRDGVRGD